MKKWIPVLVAIAACSTGPTADFEDAGWIPFGDAATPDAGSDAGETATDASPRDVGVSPDGGASPDVFDAFPDGGPVVTPDAGSDAGDADAGPFDGGWDSGPPPTPDAGYDAGPPPCLQDEFEPNATEAAAYRVSTTTATSDAFTIDPTWHPNPPLGDVDWYRVDVVRSTGLPTRARAWTQPGAPGWVRVRYYCGGVPTRCAGNCGEPGLPTCSRAWCESVGLNSAQVTADCPARDGAHRMMVEVTPSRLDLCGHRVDFSINPG